MGNQNFVELPSKYGLKRYNFHRVQGRENTFSVELDSQSSITLTKRDGIWSTEMADLKPEYHTRDEIGDAILAKIENG